MRSISPDMSTMKPSTGIETEKSQETKSGGDKKASSFQVIILVSESVEINLPPSFVYPGCYPQ